MFCDGRVSQRQMGWIGPVTEMPPCEKKKKTQKKTQVFLNIFSLPRALLLTIIPSTNGITMLNFPVAPCSFILNKPVFKGWMKITGTSFSGMADLKEKYMAVKSSSSV